MFGLIFRNEWEKIWARKKFLFIAGTLVIILATVGFAWRTEQSMLQQLSAQSPAASIAQAIQQTKAQLKTASAKQKPLLRQQLAQQEAAQVQIEQSTPQTGTMRTASDLKRLSQASGSGPNAGQSALLIALDHYRLAHGITRFNTARDSGLRLLGLVFSGPAVIMFAMMVVGFSNDTVSGERQDHTIPFLFLHGFQRGRILAAKVLATSALVALQALASAVGIFALASIVMGVGPAYAPHALGIRMQTSKNSFAGAPPTVLPVAAQHFFIVSQWQYDIAAVLLAILGLAALVVIMTGISLLSRTVSMSAFLCTILLISTGFWHLLAGSAVIGLDPMVDFNLMAAWNGQTALQSGVAGLGLVWAFAVMALWVVAVGWLSVVRFRRIEP
ncbi:MAG: ABC transporter permease subunit [Thermaerobacter sp.]|nr:ABC transporter permease subunit [Thermaerobacter sp.]